MLFRLASFALVLLAAGLAGWAGADWPGVAAGLAAGGLIWVLADLLRGYRFIRWLRQGAAAGPPSMGGLWGEAGERAWRAIRLRENQAREHQDRLAEFLAAIQASPSGVVLLDSNEAIEWCNETAARHFGLDLRQDMRQLIGNMVRDPVFTAYNAAQDYRHEITIPGREDMPGRPVRLSVQFHPYGDGRRLMLSRDVTAVAQAEAMRRDFVANVSHEIRTPLTVLSGFIETLQSLQLGEAERAYYLALMATQAERMQSLVNDLLTLSRLEGTPAPGYAEWVTVQALNARCEEEGRALSGLLYPEPAAAQLLRFDEVPGLELAGTASELRSALSNLVSNAVRYTPAGGAIDVAWSRLPDGRVEFAVTDTGPGIAPEHLPRLSERFYRVDRSRSRESGGTGLGLAIAKHVAQRHGGELRIASTLGKGSRFSVVFPASRVRQAAGPTASVAAPATPGR